MVIRSLAEANSNMPATANIASGNTSVWLKPARTLARSSADPGTSAAWATKSVSVPNDRSAMSISPPIDTAKIVPWMNKAGPSMATAPSTTILRVLALSSTANSAATRPPRARVVWVSARTRRGAIASISTPTVAAPNTISIGARAAYSMLGAWIASGSLLVPPAADTIDVSANEAAVTTNLQLRCQRRLPAYRPGQSPTHRRAARQAMDLCCRFAATWRRPPV